VSLVSLLEESWGRGKKHHKKSKGALRKILNSEWTRLLPQQWRYILKSLTGRSEDFPRRKAKGIDDKYDERLLSPK